MTVWDPLQKADIQRRGYEVWDFSPRTEAEMIKDNLSNTKTHWNQRWDIFILGLNQIQSKAKNDVIWITSHYCAVKPYCSNFKMPITLAQ